MLFRETSSEKLPMSYISALMSMKEYENILKYLDYAFTEYEAGLPRLRKQAVQKLREKMEADRSEFEEK